MLSHALLLSVVFTVCFAVPSNIRRPCNLTHYDCVGETLAANSRCSRGVSGRVPSAYRIPRFVFHTPTFNSSYVEKDLIIRNHHRCFLSEFFLNKVDKTAVIGIDCPNLDFQSTRTMVQHVPRREDVIYSYEYRGLYPLIHLTTTLQISNQMDMCSTLAFAELTGLPTYQIQPNDKKTGDYLSRDLSLLNVFERETLWWRANSLMRIFVNSLLCDYFCDF